MPARSNAKNEVSFSSDEEDSLETGSARSGSGAGESTTSSTESSCARISQRETRDVRRLRLVVLLVLVCSAIGVALSVYFYVTLNEQSQFERQFKDDSEKIFHAIGESIDKMLGAMDGLAVTAVSYARDTNKAWPFVSLPNIAVRMSKVVPLTDAFNLLILPLVTHANRAAWEEYSLKNDFWVDESVAVQESWDDYHGPVAYKAEYNGAIHDDFNDMPENEIYLPTWQNFPLIPNTTWTYNWDWLAATGAKHYDVCLKQHKSFVSMPYMIPDSDDPAVEAETIAWAEFYRAFIQPEENPAEPISDLLFPIIDDIDRVAVTGAKDYNPKEHSLVGTVGASFYYREIFRNILPSGSDGIDIVVSNPCTLAFTYRINGPRVEYLGANDKHDPAYNSLRQESRLDELGRFAIHGSGYTGPSIDNSACPLTFSLYPSDAMKDRFTSNNAIIFTVCVLCIFAFTSLVFYLYDIKVEHRQERVSRTAARSSAIVSSLFPSAVRDRVFPEAPETAKGKLHNFLRDKSPPQEDLTNTGDSPIAELYPETTVLFADIVGFTSWSSSRQPTQVFHLLESVFAVFDEIAKRRGVFKVETIGDSYVAVVGLPTPRKHHAVTMARFANDCRAAMYELTRELDTVLGPGTAELAMRFGLNSGPTTAGVLRGEKSRFQLFGDTVNTAARMESNGKPHEIQVSQKTAELLKVAGKTHWLTRREEQVDCKGKGMLTTYWCNPSTLGYASVASRSECSQFETDSVDENRPDTGLKGSLNGLVDWNFDLLQGLLKDIVGYRAEHSSADSKAQSANFATRTPRDEVVEVLALPKTLRSWPDNTSTKKKVAPVLPEVVLTQLRELVVSIAKRYHANAFHNFEHCSHVVMSTRKLLARIAVRAVELRNKNKKGNNSSSSSSTNMDQGVCAIVCHPMTQFALVLAALIHDVDHPGVSNAQLVQEGSDVAVAYNGQSVAEQRSIDVAWNLLAQAQFANLMECLCATPGELAHFRQVMVHAVVATDLFDPDLKSMREARWKKSFHTADGMSCETEEDVNRRATIVLELIIQASDVSHTMQHFTVYRKWNQRLLNEMHEAYASGRTTKNPLEGWYEGELGFLDHYVIPLAQKLRECGVFGVACDEFLDYAKDNRLEWEAKGRDIVCTMVADIPVRETVMSKSDSSARFEL